MNKRIQKLMTDQNEVLFERDRWAVSLSVYLSIRITL